MVVEQVNQQQMAVLSNLSSAEGMNQILRAEMESKTDADNATKIGAQKNLLKQVLEGKVKQGDVGTHILASLANKLAQTMPASRLANNFKEEYQLLIDGDKGTQDDVIDLKNAVLNIARGQKQRQQNQGQNQNQQSGSGHSPEEEGKPAAALSEYIGAYSQMLIAGGSEVKKKLEQMENRLLKDEGLPVKDLQSVKTQVANSVRGEVLQQLKQNFLKQALTEGKSLEWLVAQKEVGNFIEYVFLNKRLGGKEFGGYENGLEGAAVKMKLEAREELKDFLDDALREQIVKKVVSEEGNEKTEKEIETLLKLGQKIGFDIQKFMEKIPDLKSRLGLSALICFEYADAGAGANDNQQQRRQYQYTFQDEQDVLVDKLRALYLRRALYGDMRTVLETQYKMIKLKNGLIRLGIKNFDETEKEGNALAKVKLLEMLREGFEERATYAKLSGPAWKMTENKIKTVIKNLGNLGVNLTENELSLVRDKANSKMSQVAEHELALINTAIEVRGEISYLTSKKKMAQEILQRLAEESGLQAPGNEIELSIKEAC